MPIILDAFIQNLRGTKSARTTSAYEHTACKLLDYLGDPRRCPTRAEVEQFLARPLLSGEPRAATTYNHELAGVRALARAMTESGEWPSDPCRGIRPRKESRKDPAFLTDGELGRLFEAASADADPISRARNLAIVALLSQLGLRVHEVSALNVSQVDERSDTLLAVHGKGDTKINMPMSREVTAFVLDWIRVRPSWAASTEPGIFVSKKTQTRMSVRSVERLIDNLWSRCNSPKRITPHSLRHTTCTLLVWLGVDISSVGDLARHSSLDTTRRYVGLVGERRRMAVNSLAVTIPRSVLPSAIRSVDPSEITPTRPQLSVVQGSKKDVDEQEEFGDAA